MQEYVLYALHSSYYVSHSGMQHDLLLFIYDNKCTISRDPEKDTPRKSAHVDVSVDQQVLSGRYQQLTYS